MNIFTQVYLNKLAELVPSRLSFEQTTGQSLSPYGPNGASAIENEVDPEQAQEVDLEPPQTMGGLATDTAKAFAPSIIASSLTGPLVSKATLSPVQQSVMSNLTQSPSKIVRGLRGVGGFGAGMIANEAVVQGVNKVRPDNSTLGKQMINGVLDATSDIAGGYASGAASTLGRGGPVGAHLAGMGGAILGGAAGIANKGYQIGKQVVQTPWSHLARNTLGIEDPGVIKMQQRLQGRINQQKTTLPEIKEYPGQVDPSAPVYSDAPKPFGGQWFGGRQ